MNRKTMRAISTEEMRDVALKGKRGNFNLSQAIQAILEYKKRGESVSYRFNGFKLESNTLDSVDEITKKYDEALHSQQLPRELYAEEMRDVALKGKRGNFNLSQAIQAMLEYKKRGESVYYIFNGFELNSDEITTLEETEEMYDLFMREENQQKALISIKNATKNALSAGISIEDIEDLMQTTIEEKNKGGQIYDK